MANIQVKNVPSLLQRKLRLKARRQGRTIREVVLAAIERDLQREEFIERLARRSRTDLRAGVARALEGVRTERELELGE